MTQWIDTVPAAQLDPGRCRVVDIDDVAIALYNIDGSFYAIEDTCTHDGGELASGELDGDVVICPRHGARFCIRTGEVLCPPAYEDIDCYPVRIVDGMVQIGDEPVDD